ncbi:MAG TPA: amidase [Saliniramus sp.]|nr:amidase [Saliniramus sp.]
MSEILSYDAHDLLAGYRNRSLSPREATQAALDAIARFEPALNAFLMVDGEGALAAAGESEKRWARGEPAGLLDGLPMTIKDNIAWAGHTMKRGSVTSADTTMSETSPVVERMVAHGAVPLGRTTMPEFGWKGLGDSPLHGITRNPWDTRMTTGGSSAGAAAAAALNLGVLHIGTDGAGSIRIPSGFSGIYGIKPSYGRIPAHPPSPFSIVSHIGPMTRSVRDAALMLTATAGPDGRDITAIHTPAPDFRIGLEDGVRGLRIAWSPRLGYVQNLHPDVEALTARAARVFEELGAHVDEVDPGFPEPLAILETLWQTGAWSVIRQIPESRWSEVDPGLLAAALKGREYSGSDFVAAAGARNALFATMARFHERYDLLLTPTLATTAFEGGNDTPPDGSFGGDWLAWAPYSYPFNLTLQPAATVPCGLTAAGLPVGLQIVGPMLADAKVLAASRAFESARPWPKLSEPNIRH